MFSTTAICASRSADCFTSESFCCLRDLLLVGGRRLRLFEDLAVALLDVVLLVLHQDHFRLGLRHEREPVLARERRSGCAATEGLTARLDDQGGPVRTRPLAPRPDGHGQRGHCLDRRRHVSRRGARGRRARRRRRRGHARVVGAGDDDEADEEDSGGGHRDRDPGASGDRRRGPATANGDTVASTASWSITVCSAAAASVSRRRPSIVSRSVGIVDHVLERAQAAVDQGLHRAGSAVEDPRDLVDGQVLVVPAHQSDALAVGDLGERVPHLVELGREVHPWPLGAAVALHDRTVPQPHPTLVDDGPTQVAAGVVEAAEPRPHLHEGVLHEVLGGRVRAGEQVGQPHHRRPVRPVERGQRVPLRLVRRLLLRPVHTSMMRGAARTLRRARTFGRFSRWRAGGARCGWSRWRPPRPTSGRTAPAPPRTPCGRRARGAPWPRRSPRPGTAGGEAGPASRAGSARRPSARRPRRSSRSRRTAPTRGPPRRSCARRSGASRRPPSGRWRRRRSAWRASGPSSAAATSPGSRGPRSPWAT